MGHIDDVIAKNRAGRLIPAERELDPGDKRDMEKIQLDAEFADQTALEQQAHEWRNNGHRSPALLARGTEIIIALKGQPFDLLELEEKHAVYMGYLYTAALRRGYMAKMEGEEKTSYYSIPHSMAELMRLRAENEALRCQKKKEGAVDSEQRVPFDDTIDYGKGFFVHELRGFAQQQSIRNYSNMKKAELIEALNAHRA